MIKIAILGAENSHSSSFSKYLAPKNGEKLFPDIELIGVYGDKTIDGFDEAAKQIPVLSTAQVYSDDYNRFLDEADAVMVTARHGANHFKYAKEYIKKGIPVWIDKPFTCDVTEAKEMTALAAEYGAPICGGSSLEHAEGILKMAEIAKNAKEICGGTAIAPIHMDSPYGGFWFYSQHLVAMIIKVFGQSIRAVRAFKDAKGVHAVYSYDDFSVSAFFGGGYAMTLCTSLDEAVSEPITLGADYCVPELKGFYNTIKTGKSDKTAEELVLPVIIQDATIRAYTENREIMVEK